MVFGVIPCASILSLLETCPRRIKGAGHAAARLGLPTSTLRFRRNDEEEKLLAQSHAEDALPKNSGERTADQISSKEGRDDGRV